MQYRNESTFGRLFRKSLTSTLKATARSCVKRTTTFSISSLDASVISYHGWVAGCQRAHERNVNRSLSDFTAARYTLALSPSVCRSTLRLHLCICVGVSMCVDGCRSKNTLCARPMSDECKRASTPRVLAVVQSDFALLEK